MTTCDDPYRELELYLEKAQEEVGMAVKELEEHEEGMLYDTNDGKSSFILLPQPFQGDECTHKSNNGWCNGSSSVKRVCYDGKVQDFQDSSEKVNFSINGSSRPSFVSSFNKEIAPKDGKVTYSPNTRRKLWRMHPSISFPETSKDLLKLGKDTQESYSDTPFNKCLDNNTPDECILKDRRYRQRSHSDTLAPLSCYDIPEHSFTFPRPPSGDVNLLSIWADNLVLELDKSLSGELMNSLESFSPSSDYSLSPNKQDENVEEDSRHFEVENEDQHRLLESNFLSRSGRNLKTVSKSPDSGIEHTSCDTPEMADDCVDSSMVSRLKMENLNYNLLIAEENTEHITPPPSQFKDEEQKIFNKSDRSQSTQTNRCFRKRSGSLKSAELVLEPQETTEHLKTLNQLPDAQVIASETIPELKNFPLIQTVCAVNDVSVVKTDVTTDQRLPFNSSLNENDYSLPIQPFVSSSYGSAIFSSLPKPPKTLPYSTEKCSTFPGNKSYGATFPQRSASQSAMNYVSIDELAAFMRKVKNGANHPPSCADVSTDVKDDKENRDAVTQTTPVPLSRSSSFTWVTECDCSDLESHNANCDSNESLNLSGCSNCKVENEDFDSSSSSIDASSEDCESPTPGSVCSSLYLSACSGSSDSFDEETLLNDDINKEPAKLIDDVFLPSTHRSIRSSESTLRGSVLGDITEEQITSETISVKSNISNPSLADGNNFDSAEQSASFPSTLRVSRRNRSTGSPAQPIEPTVLVINDTKSVSAPVLLRQKRFFGKSKIESSSSDSSPPSASRSIDGESETILVPGKSPSPKELNELQAIEACSWLRAAGFPQYAQMYEDNQFPIDITLVQLDHEFLHPDSMQSLFRRLNSLNRCAKQKFMDHGHCRSLALDDSDEEEQYALSENWEFERSSRRWSRITEDGADIATNEPSTSKIPDHVLAMSGRKYLSPGEAYCSSHDSVFVDDQHSSPDSIRRSAKSKSEKISLSPSSHIGDCSPGSSSGSGTLSLASEDTQERRSLRRSGSDRVKEGARALLRRMESLKGKRKKKTADVNKLEKAAMPNNGTDGSSSSSLTSSPQFGRSHRREAINPDFQLGESSRDIGAYSDSECASSFVSNQSNTTKVNSTKKAKPYVTPETSVTITGPQDDFPLSRNEEKKEEIKADSIKKDYLHPNCSTYQSQENANRGSYYDNVSAPIVVFNDLFTDCFEDNAGMSTSKGEGPFAEQNQEDGDIIIVHQERRDSGVGSSLTRGGNFQQTPYHCFPLHCSTDTKFLYMPVPMCDLTVPQIILLKKVSLLRLTTVMEKFSPPNKTGWSWGVTKFICRIRSPDYKDKVVFGVPLILIQQRTGQPLPISIQAAMDYLRNTAMDAIGLFRKSGVRSRIQKLKTLNETDAENTSYEEQQAYDVADMIKQYFRELPEVLLTNKLSETFIGIFQYVPEELRLEAIQSALMLMPDENREVLQALLEFLYEVSQHSDKNQMTATNIAVCFAPSLFHLTSPRSASSSPRRRKTVGVPDLRELNENKSAYECLSCMVSNYQSLFTVPADVIAQSRISSATHFTPATLEDMNSFIFDGQPGWKGFVDNCIQVFLKDARDKYKGWKSVSSTDHVDLAYKKLSDGHPLKLWKVSTEVEAPPVELLNKVLRERHLWDTSFTKSKVITRLNKNSEVYQYVSTYVPPHSPCDHVVLRSWRTDLPKGACVLIETSIEHSEAEAMPGTVRALVLASRYLIEPCGSGKSRITYISRIDTRGRSIEWYNRAYSYVCTQLLIKLRNSCACARAEGPETKV